MSVVAVKFRALIYHVISVTGWYWRNFKFVELQDQAWWMLETMDSFTWFLLSMSCSRWQAWPYVAY
jgi:hypothetical protein